MRRLISRRHMLRGAAAGATGLAGVAALAACGETQIVTKEVPVETTVIKEVPVEKIVRETEVREVPVEKIVTQQVDRIVTQTVEVEKVVEKVVTETVEVEKVVEKVVEVMVEAPPETRTVKIEHATDHTSGPRGAAMSWAIERFAVQRPDIKVKFIPQDHIYYEKIAVEAVAGTLSETNLLNGVSFQQFSGAGIWLQIDDILAKKDGYDPSNYWFQPDIYSDNMDQSYPYDATRLQGPLYGMPYQGAIGGLMYNITLFEGAGANQPTEGMRYSDLLEEMKKIRDPDNDVWGIRATRSEQFQVFPQMYGYNNGQARVDGPNGHQIWGPPLDDGWRGWQDIVDYIHTENVSYTPEERSGLSGEFGNPFAAGRQAVDIGGSVYGTGGNIPRIRDRFQWSLGPMPWGENTDHANFEWNDQPHIVAGTATVTGVEEQAVDWVYFLAGPEVQGRVSIDRGHLPTWKDVANLPEALAGPPEGMHYLYEYIANPNLRAMQWYVPGGFYSEIRSLWRPVMDGALVGEISAQESTDTASERVNDLLAKFQGQLDAGDVKR